jgi:hypothetical protein
MIISKVILIDRLAVCMFNLMNLDVLSDASKVTILLGEPFLKKFYTVFDHELMRIGFAEARHNN